MQERKDGGRLNTKASRKRTKFQLDSDDSDGDDNDVFMGFTHKGKKLIDDHDDFNEQIPQSSDDEDNKDKGKLNEEMVNRLNFGGGEIPEEGKKKTRKEIFQEIVDKSKTFDAARKEMKQINTELQEELDDEYQDLLRLLKYETGVARPLEDQLREKHEAESKMTKKELAEKKAREENKQPSYEEIRRQLVPQTKQAPLKQGQLTEKEQALARKKKLVELESEQQQKALEEAKEQLELGEGQVIRKRDDKLQSKRDIAIAKSIKERKDETKHEDRAAKVEEEFAKKIAKNAKKATVDEDLLSLSEAESDDGSESDEGSHEEEGEAEVDEPLEVESSSNSQADEKEGDESESQNKEEESLQDDKSLDKNSEDESDMSDDEEESESELVSIEMEGSG